MSMVRAIPTPRPRREPYPGVPQRSLRAAAAEAAAPPGPRAAASEARAPAARSAPSGGIEVRDGALWLDGKETFLFGGDLHYFRVRDRDASVEKTHQMWAASLDRMKAAGLNLVTTYVPWDYHGTGPDSFDFSGTRDLRRFLELARARGMKVVLKPGPLITGEWPRGPGSFGAVPQWFKDAHPGSMARDGAGRFFTMLPFGGARDRQPAVLDPTYLGAVRQWYARFLQEVQPYLGDTVVGLQLDNETNGYWGDRFGGPGYDPAGKAFFRRTLAARYGDIAALNAAWGTSFASLDDVEPPRRAPVRGGTAGERARARDWYEAGVAMQSEYLQALKDMLLQLGLDTRRVLLTANDSPFQIKLGRLPLRQAVLMPDGRKNTVAHNAIDLYPKFSGAPRLPANEPFQVDFFVRLFDQRADRDGEAQDFLWGAELQGGLYPLGNVSIPPAATDQLLLRSIAHGLKGGALYVIQDGLNADNSVYAYQAALSLDGTPTARYEVVQRWGKLLATYGSDLQHAREVHSRVAILVDSSIAGCFGGEDNAQSLLATEAPALFGWLQNAGFNVDVIDAATVTDEALRGYAAVVVQSADQDSSTLRRPVIDRARDAGAAVINFCSPLEQGTEAPVSRWWNLQREGRVIVSAPGLEQAVDLPSYWYTRSPRALPEGAEPLAWTHSGRRAVGWIDRSGKTPTMELLTNVYRRFNEAGYYSMDATEHGSLSSVARALLGAVGERPLVDGLGVRELVWPRVSPERTYLFAANDNDEARVLAPRLVDPARCGLAPEARYHARDALHGRELGTFTTRELQEGALRIPLEPFGAAVVTLEPADAP